jgi:peroxiredoxin
MMKNVFAAFLCLIISAVSAQELSKFGIEAGTEGRGLKLGEIAPDFELKNAEGEAFSLYQALEKGEVAVIFYRGAWCPVCSRYLTNFTDSLELLTSADIQPVFVTPNKSEKLKETADKTEGKLTLLMDENYKVMDAYRVSFEVTDGYKKMFKNYTGETVESMNAANKSKLPVPATFVIGQDKKVKYVHFNYDYSKRASVQDILNNK